MKLFFLLCLSILSSLSAYSQGFVRSELSTTVSTPWEILRGPGDYLWLTESGGVVSRVFPSTGNKDIVYTAPDYFEGSPIEISALCPELPIQHGTLGLALHPDFTYPETSFIYFVYSYNSGSIAAPATKFRIKRLKWDASTSSVVSDTNIVNLITTGYDHIGGRLMAIKQNSIPYLFLSVGDNGGATQNGQSCYSSESEDPNNFTQDVETQNGKIHRFSMDGTIPSDNPISANSFYSRGHRNPQGLMYNPTLEIIYDVEHGDRTDDEINILHKGMNYGWKDVRGYHYDNSFPEEDSYVENYVAHPQIANDSLVEPLYAWCTTPSTSSVWTDWCTVAPSGGIYYGSDGIPQWENSLLVVTLKDGISTDREVYQFKLESDGNLAPSTIENPNPKKFFGTDQAINGRLRDITFSNNGQKIYLINNGGASSDKITVYTYDSTSTGLSQFSQELDIRVFPNPTTNRLSIKGLKDDSDLNEVHISNLLGKSSMVTFDSDQNIDVSSYSNGIYFIRFTYENKTHTLKFIKY